MIHSIKLLCVTDTKVLRPTAGVRHNRSDAIRQKIAIADKMSELRLLWYGHVLFGKGGRIHNVALNFKITGRRSRWRLKQRPSNTLLQASYNPLRYKHHGGDRKGQRHGTRKQTLPQSGNSEEEQRKEKRRKKNKKK